ncbi:PepSY-associated TM helix domain-containing protein [Luteibacter yeojuensis]|uniref:Iron-regulated membrane protein n=1 Tax=Luteibacter yeojuensis TaxID=345309 RepID=A0A0F3KU59_9GAMM|nr:PepSY-associated TM helix domain-containing protein [Luteibacter yeojuensis]KJV34753.1 hypothetical protein VI08_09170 [Luteibacter yeojuensis]
MKRRALRAWDRVHTWSSLVVTVFLFVAGLTGLPLLFSDEISDAFDPSLPGLSGQAGRAPVDAMVRDVERAHPGHVVVATFLDPRHARVTVTSASSWAAFRDDADSAVSTVFDVATGKVVLAGRADNGPGDAFIQVVHDIHESLFLGPPGTWVMLLVALCFLASLASGIVLYAPFNRGVGFANVRRQRTRTAWLDRHNFHGIVLAAWACVVAATGMLNALERPLFDRWQAHEVTPRIAATDVGAPPVGPARRVSLDRAIAAARRATPGMRLTGIVFPGSPYGTPVHFVAWSQGASTLTAELYQPVLVDARTATVTAVLPMPWYLRSIELSRPLHFGNVGGLAMKIAWAAADALLMGLLGSGIYLWLTRRRRPG